MLSRPVTAIVATPAAASITARVEVTSMSGPKPMLAFCFVATVSYALSDALPSITTLSGDSVPTRFETGASTVEMMMRTCPASSAAVSSSEIVNVFSSAPHPPKRLSSARPAWSVIAGASPMRSSDEA